MRVASLAMYDFPWTARAKDALWAALRTRLLAAGLDGLPPALERERPLMAIWRDPALLLARTCGYPLVTELGHSVRVVTTPCHDLPGCDGAWHRSFIVVREDDGAAGLSDLRGRRCAINGRDSNSGMNMLRAAIAPLAGRAAFFGDVIVTGAHLDSLRAVREGRADTAAIDCVTHGLAGRHRPDLLAGTRVLAWTQPTPGLPLVTGPATSADGIAALREALDGVMADPALAAARHDLALAGFRVVPAEDYAPVLELQRAAIASGYPELR